jgi:hypothetical protein
MNFLESAIQKAVIAIACLAIHIYARVHHVDGFGLHLVLKKRNKEGKTMEVPGIIKCMYGVKDPDRIVNGDYCTFTNQRCPGDGWVDQQPQGQCQYGVVIIANRTLASEVLNRLFGRPQEMPWEAFIREDLEWVERENISPEDFKRWYTWYYGGEIEDPEQRRSNVDLYETALKRYRAKLNGKS